MNPLLSYLTAYLAPLYTIAPYNLKGVFVGNSYDIDQLVGKGFTPFMALEPGPEFQSAGNFQNQIRRHFVVTIRFIVNPANSTLYRDPNSPVALSNLTDSLRTSLAQNKTLGTLLDPFRYEIESLGQAVEIGNGRWLERQLRCEWARDERWDGAINDQQTLEPMTA